MAKIYSNCKHSNIINNNDTNNEIVTIKANKIIKKYWYVIPIIILLTTNNEINLLAQNILSFNIYILWPITMILIAVWLKTTEP